MNEFFRQKNESEGIKISNLSKNLEASVEYERILDYL